MLKLVVNVSSEYQGCHPDDLSVSVYNNESELKRNQNDGESIVLLSHMASENIVSISSDNGLVPNHNLTHC